MCDIDGDGTDELVTAPGPGYLPVVKVWKLTPQGPSRMLNFVGFPDFARMGIFVACGDVDGDGASEIIVSKDHGGGAKVKIYRRVGTSMRLLREFVAHEPSFTSGVRVATADVDGDGLADVITAPGPGSEPVVRAFKVSGTAVTELTAFQAEDPSVTGGLFVAGGKRDDLGGVSRDDRSRLRQPAPRPRLLRLTRTAGRIDKLHRRQPDNLRRGHRRSEPVGERQA